MGLRFLCMGVRKNVNCSGKHYSEVKRQRFLVVITLVLCIFSASPVFAQFNFLKGITEAQATGEDAVSLKVIDAYADMHSGPGRGYPIFYVVEEGEWIEILTRRPDWYEVRTLRGKVGWVTANQIARTLQDTGEPADLPTVSYGDYQKNNWRVGMVAGNFISGEFSDASTFNATLGYRPLSWLGLEFESGRILGNDIRGTTTSGNLVFEPFSSWRLSPAMVIGGGQTKIKAQPNLPQLDQNNFDHFQFGVRANFYLGRNFVIRGEYKILALSSSASSDAEEIDQEDSGTWNFGFSTFF